MSTNRIERTNISSDNRVVANPTELRILLTKHAPQNGWLVSMGYAKTTTGLNKTNANRRADNEEFGRGLHHWFIDRYLDSDDYKRVGEPNIGKNGKPLKTTHKATNPFEAEGVNLVTFINLRAHWNSGDYENDCNRRRLIVNRYMEKPIRLARLTGPQSEESNPHCGDAMAFYKKAAAYYKDKGEEAIPADQVTPELAAEIWNYVRPSAAAKGSGEGNPKFNFYESKPDINPAKPTYFLVTPEHGIEQVNDDFVRFWRCEFGSAPKQAPTSSLTALLDRLVPGRFHSYLLSNIAYMAFTCKANANSQAQRILYVNEDLNLDGEPEAAKRLMAMARIDKGQAGLAANTAGGW